MSYLPPLTYQIGTARILASAALHGQVDKSGRPMFDHCQRVADLVPYELRVEAYLHDLVEDTSVTLLDIVELFGVETRNIIDALTRRENEPYGDYIERVARSIEWSRIPCTVKFADLQDHLVDIGPLSRSHVARYRKAMGRIDEALREG